MSTTSPTGETVVEEDKSSLNGNPVTDRSVDLWKTFSNWVNAVNSGRIQIPSTRFVLFRTKCGNKAIVEAFDSAKNQDEATSALESAKEQLKDIGPSHEAWEFYSNAALQNPKILIGIIERFQLETGDGAGFAEVSLEVKKKHVPASQIDFVIQNLSGWLTKQVMERIAEKKQAAITWEEFDNEFIVLFDRSRRRELIDFALKTPPNIKDVEHQVEVRPKYLRQLELINSSDDELINAVTDYLRAKINRDKWIEAEIIDEDVAHDFEKRLEAFWKNQQKQINIVHSHKSDQEKGALLLIECQSRQESIRDMSPPNSTIAGTYHALADVPTVGWHPDWVSISKKWE